jgi:PTH1 family peptidyl-tRNA hydrolase
MKLVVGLGNPGKTYTRNRHNVGFHCIKYLSETYSIPTDKRQCSSRLGTGKINGIDVVLAKPQTFMNLSGQAVSGLVRRYKIKPAYLLVIHDDIDLPVGKIRLRVNGGSGGHRGIESIIAALGTRDFNRIRMGIGRPQETETDKEESVVNHVLSNFSPEEERTIKELTGTVGDAVSHFLSQGIESAMNKFN